MRVFLDNNVPVGVARLLSHHTVALVVLGSNIWPIVREYAASILASGGGSATWQFRVHRNATAAESVKVSDMIEVPVRARLTEPFAQRR
jgi:hypothetical protein